ncbi:MAG: PQQ-binding-like beta-propeller repeat protein [Verrucomicrobiia bacterium]
MVLVFSQAGVRAQAPQAPSSVSASDGEFTNRVEISWAAGADAVSYEVWRATEPVFEDAVLLGEANETTFSDTAWPPEQTYYYWVVAKNFVGSGPPGGPDAGSRSDVSVGETLWTYDAAAADHGVLKCTPAFGPDGTIYVLAGGGHLVALNPDGSEKWVFDTGVVARNPDHYGNSPAVDVDGTIYFGWVDGQFYAVNPDGTRKWRTKLGEAIWTSPALGHDGRIYVGAEDGGFYALSRSGDRLWFIPTEGPNDAPPTIGTDGIIYFAKRDGWENRIVAVDRNGKIKWEVDSEHGGYGGGVASSVVEGQFGVLYFMNQEAKLILLNRDGTKRAEIDTNGNENTSYRASPVIGDDGTSGVPGTVYSSGFPAFSCRPAT